MRLRARTATSGRSQSGHLRPQARQGRRIHENIGAPELAVAGENRCTATPPKVVVQRQTDLPETTGIRRPGLGGYPPAVRGDVEC